MSRLVISRNEKQTVIIDGCVTITVLSTGRTKLAIDAPPDVKILRGELVARDEQEVEHGSRT